MAGVQQSRAYPSRRDASISLGAAGPITPPPSAEGADVGTSHQEKVSGSGGDASAESQAIVRVLDAGCGEGYYLSTTHQRLLDLGYHPECFGIDISPLAVSDI